MDTVLTGKGEITALVLLQLPAPAKRKG